MEWDRRGACHSTHAIGSILPSSGADRQAGGRPFVGASTTADDTKSHSYPPSTSVPSLSRLVAMRPQKVGPFLLSWPFMTYGKTLA